MHPARPHARRTSHASRTRCASPASDFVFVHYSQQDGRGSVQDEAVRGLSSVRAQAAKASAITRLDTLRRRAASRHKQHGQGVFSLQTANSQQDHMSTGEQRSCGTPAKVAGTGPVSSGDRQAALFIYAYKSLGETITAAQLDAASLGHFLRRFDPGVSTERPWIELVSAEMDSRQTPSLSAIALQANASALCANDLKHPVLYSRARKQYLTALRQLQAVLRTPKWSDSDVLYTSMILTLYECILSSDQSSRLTHVRGVSQLIYQRGPLSFSQGLDHKVFRYYRINMLMVALVDRQDTFLAQEQWKTIPWSNAVAPKTMFDRLIDILADLPGLLCAIETLRKEESSSFARMQHVFNLVCWVRRLISDLESWKAELLWSHPTLSADHERLKSLNLVALCEFCVDLSPDDPVLVESINCYCAAHLVLARIAWNLHHRSFLLGLALPMPHTLGDLMQAIVIASRKQLDSAKTGIINLVVATFGLKVVQTTTEIDAQELVKEAQVLLEEANVAFARRFNIEYTVPYG